MQLPKFLSLRPILYIVFCKFKNYYVVNKKTVPEWGGKDHIMKTKTSNNTVYIITAVLSVLVLLLAAVGFTNVETDKVERISASTNLIKHAGDADSLAVSMGLSNTVYSSSVQSAADDADDELARMAESLRPVAELGSDASTLDRDVAYLLNNSSSWSGSTYGEICSSVSAAAQADIDAANHDAAVWTAVCAILALAGIAGLVVSVTNIEYGKH